MAQIETFLAEVEEAAKALRHLEQRVWYRGLSNAEYLLLPSLFREPKGRPRDKDISYDLRVREKNLFARFQMRAGELLPPRLESSWEVLSVMQHYGVPTRVMDWTESLFVALYFALEYKDENRSPCIWLLNPFELNKASLGRSVIFDQVDRLQKNAHEHAYEAFIEKISSKQDGWPPELPVATTPIWGHVRVLSQRGFFTIQGTDSNPLDQQAKARGLNIVRQIKIPDDAHAPLRQLLKQAGMDHYSLFPDLEGLARALRQRYGWT
jgi:hypothetical protein